MPSCSARRLHDASSSAACPVQDAASSFSDGWIDHLAIDGNCALAPGDRRIERVDNSLG